MDSDQGIKWFNCSFYPTHKVCRAHRLEDGVIPRLRQEDVLLFSPWGPRYSFEQRGRVIRPEDKEVQTLQFLAGLQAEFEAHLLHRNWRWLFLGADLYGTKINNLPSDAVQEYFFSLEEWVRKLIPNAEFRLWSDYNEEAEKYRRVAREKLRELVSLNIAQRAQLTASRMGRGGNPTDYLVERLAEAMLIEERYRPIKMSVVARAKDAEVDHDLPRLYFVPTTLNAPWL